MKKVVFLAKYFAPHVGGVEEHVAKLSQELKKKGYQVTIVTNQHDEKLLLREEIENLKILRIPKQVFDEKNQTWLWILQHTKVFFQADIIHAHDVFWWILPIRFLLFWKKFAITFHGYEGSEPPKESQIKAHQLWNKLSEGSLAIGAFHDKWYQLQSTAISYGAIDTFHFQKKKKVNKNISAIYIGRLSEDVGIMEYLKAIKNMKDKGNNIELDVYGDGDQRKIAEDFVRKHKLSVKFFGYVPHAEQKLAEYDIAFVSRYLAILSALYQQVTVIAHANNDIKFDYLSLSPFANWISICQNSDEIKNSVLHHTKVPIEAKNWATGQTWQKMSDLYEKIWAV